MTTKTEEGPAPAGRTVYLVASGDSRTPANLAGWPAQWELEQAITKAAATFGVEVHRAHKFDPALGHGFIDNQRKGMDVFANIDPDAAVIVAEAVWQFSQHVLGGLLHHRGPILTVANWSGQWPGLVGLLNLNASLAKAGRPFSTIWSETFDDDFFRSGMESWLQTGKIDHDTSHVARFDPGSHDQEAVRLGVDLARTMLGRKAILGVFDEGCMGMFNAILDDYLLHDAGIFKERLSQSALVAAMGQVTDDEANAVRAWLEDRDFTFVTGSDEATELTDAQLHQQFKMYIAAGRMAHRYSCDAIGIQYQLGLADSVPASDLAEGLLNDAGRPPITVQGTNEVIRPGQPIPHFNEVDEGVGVDLLVTNQVWNALGLDPSATLHDVRWGEEFDFGDETRYVWVFLISGSVPAAHLIDGYAGGRSERQPAMYFKLGGGTLSGTSRPGHVVWSRVYQLQDALHVDVGLAEAVELPAEETQRRLDATTPEWPIMHAVLHGVDRDQFMARHKSNHVTVAYADSPESAHRAMIAKAAMFEELGIEVHLCGVG